MVGTPTSSLKFKMSDAAYYATLDTGARILFENLAKDASCLELKSCQMMRTCYFLACRRSYDKPFPKSTGKFHSIPLLIQETKRILLLNPINLHDAQLDDLLDDTQEMIDVPRKELEDIYLLITNALATD